MNTKSRNHQFKTIVIGGAMLLSATQAFAQQANSAPFDFMRCLDTYEADQGKFFAKTKALMDQGKLTAPIRDAKDKEIRELYSKQFFPNIGKQGNDAANKKWCDDRVMDLRSRIAALDAPPPVQTQPQPAKPVTAAAPPAQKPATAANTPAMAAQAAKDKQCQDQLDKLEAQVSEHLNAAKAAGKLPANHESEHKRSIEAIKGSIAKMARGHVGNVCAQGTTYWSNKLTSVKRMYPNVAAKPAAAPVAASAPAAKPATAAVTSPTPATAAQAPATAKTAAPAPLSPQDFSKCNMEGAAIFNEAQARFNSQARTPKDKNDWESKKGAYFSAQKQFVEQKYQSICDKYKYVATSARDFAFSVK
jgi:hypothetical protein